MTDSSDDLDALFDQVAQQRSATLTEADATMPHALENNLCVDQISGSSDKPMYERLGTIVRQLHDSLKELGYDRSLSEMAGEISDTKDRLEYIASLTEKAANTVLNAIDESLPVQDEIVKSATDIEARWALVFEGKTSVDDFKKLAHDSRAFAARSITSGESEKARLMQIMMAQDFQDITGQIIKKVVGISQKLEQELAQLLKENAPAVLHKEKPVDLMAGPAVPQNAMGQDDVDDLLADLGF